jgi:hypothetical protein
VGRYRDLGRAGNPAGGRDSAISPSVTRGGASDPPARAALIRHRGWRACMEWRRASALPSLKPPPVAHGSSMVYCGGRGLARSADVGMDPRLSTGHGAQPRSSARVTGWPVASPGSRRA